MEKQASALVVTLGLAAFATAFAGRLTDPLIVVLAADFAAAPEHVALLETVRTGLRSGAV